MFKKFLNLEWKSFVRSAAFKQNLAVKILIGFFAIIILAEMLGAGAFAYHILRKLIEKDILHAANPFAAVNKFLIYWFAIDLLVRYFMQKMPVTNIKPLLYLPFTKGKIVKYALGKTVLSFFNVLPAFFFIPFSTVLLIEGYSPLCVISWHLAMLGITLSLNFLNVFLNNVDKVFYPVLAVFVIAGLAQYYGYFDITVYTQPVFAFFYNHAWSFIIPLMLAAYACWVAYHYFLKQLYLDAGLATAVKEAKTEDLSFLDRFGNIAVYLKNDIKLIKRNKRARSTFIMGFFFVAYGVFFMSDLYDGINGMKVFAGLFCTGGFLFTFGGLVPSWDSSYYKLMMSQNIPYKDFLLSKWWLMIIATALSFVLCSFYLFVGVDWWFAMFAAAIYNIGFNSSVVLLSGAYVKTPIDLTSNKKAFGDSKAFNVKTLLLTIPKLLLPVIIYYAFAWPFNETAGFVAIAVTGVLGLLLRNRIFGLIENIYKQEKYDTIAAYAQKD
ncbi:MAG: DUF5687 family protein [Nonlabens sp.]|nr:DUF5687 family protein [Nonlabens sp.]MDP5101674.1 DUF5687 family protein [Nonlabens sp.]